jgi:hypothetical protein
MSKISKLDAEDAINMGYSIAQEAFDGWLQQWNLPAMLRDMKPMWMQLSPKEKEKLKVANPELYQKLDSVFSNKQVG